jgi:hypothetical protein
VLEKVGSAPAYFTKRVLGRARWTKNRPCVIDDEFDAVTLLQTEPLANFEGNRDLTFAAYRAGSRHLYFTSLQ